MNKELKNSLITITTYSVILFGIGFITVTLQPKLVTIKPKPKPLPIPKPLPLEPIQTPIKLTGNLSVNSGRKYIAVINISAPLSWLTNISNIKQQSEKQGFINVIVTEKRPLHFPPGPNGDYYIEGIYRGPNKIFDRSQANGQVNIIDAWLIS